MTLRSLQLDVSSSQSESEAENLSLVAASPSPPLKKLGSLVNVNTARHTQSCV